MISLITGAENAAAALNAQRVRMDVVSQNIANANVSRGPDGKPYRRQQVVFEQVLQDQQHVAGDALGAKPQLVRVARIQEDKQPPRMLHMPGHPHADKQGNVAMPNVNIQEEMVDMIVSSRSFEANLASLKTARNMALQTLSIGKR